MRFVGEVGGKVLTNQARPLTAQIPRNKYQMFLPLCRSIETLRYPPSRGEDITGISPVELHCCHWRE